MSKPYIHALNSAKRYGGKVEDYLEIHNWFDQSKAFIADARHRALRHHAEGIFLCEKIFGVTIKNSDGKMVSVRSIAEDHVCEDFRGFIPTVQDYLMEMELKDWMVNGKSKPPSFAKIKDYRDKKKSPFNIQTFPRRKEKEEIFYDGVPKSVKCPTLID